MKDFEKNIYKIMANEYRKGASQDDRDFWHRVAVICMRHWDEMEGPGEASEDRKEEV